MSIGTSLARGTATVGAWSWDKTVRIGNGVINNGGDFFTVLADDFTAKNEVLAAKRVVDFAAQDAARAALRAQIAASRLALPAPEPVQAISSPIKPAKAVPAKA